jgi:putative DNA primase/helicase
MLAGEPDLGKSQLSAATVSTNGHRPNGEGRAELGSVIVLSAEDDAADTIIPRLTAAGAELSRDGIRELRFGDATVYGLRDSLP